MMFIYIFSRLEFLPKGKKIYEEMWLFGYLGILVNDAHFFEFASFLKVKKL
jgi:hypothetical protein